MFGAGLLLLVLGLLAAAGAVAPPGAELRWPALALAVTFLPSGFLLAYLGAPSRRPARPPGKTRAEATVLEAKVLEGAAAGYQMVELTLEVRPRDAAPFQVRRKVSAGRLGRAAPGRTVAVAFDPVDPHRVELLR